MFFNEILRLEVIFEPSFIYALKCIGAGSATISISGSAIGIGVIFGSLLLAFVRNPAHNAQLFQYAIFGFALTEALALFGLMIVLIILFI